MKIVVTGAAGFLGAQVVRELRQHDHQVIPVDIHQAKAPDLKDTKVADIAKPDETAKLIVGADAIAHLGNKPGINEDEAEEGFANNVEGTFNVFEAAFRAAIRRIVWASSIQAYGIVESSRDKASVPEYLPIDEDHPLLPRTAYQLSKQAGENIAGAFIRRVPNAQVFSLRFTAITGPDRPKERLNGALGGLQTYVDVADAARAVRLACEVEHPGHTPLNIIAPKATAPWSLEALHSAYGVVPKMRRPIEPDEALITAARAKEILGWEAAL